MTAQPGRGREPGHTAQPGHTAKPRQGTGAEPVKAAEPGRAADPGGAQEPRRTAEPGHAAKPGGAAEPGRVAALWRYPVKSMLGEELTEVAVTERGLDGDRRLALLDAETGKVASAKQPRLWRGLLAYRATASADGEPTRITAPDGGAWAAGDPALDVLLSEALGRKVALTGTAHPGATLERARPEQVLRDGLDAEVEADVVAFGSGAPPGTFFDFAPVHLVTTATLARIAELNPSGQVDTERYRPNLVLDIPEPPFAEDAWTSGGELRVGPELVLRVIACTPRCAVPTLAHGTLPRDTDALRVPAAHHRVPPLPGWSREPCVGVYAQVVRPGPVRLGDGIEWTPDDGK